jgi:hypothetical protein
MEGEEIQALLEASEDTPVGKVRSCDIQKLIKPLKVKKGLWK